MYALITIILGFMFAFCGIAGHPAVYCSPGGSPCWVEVDP